MIKIYNWIGIIIFLILILGDFRRVKDMVVYSERKTLEKTCYVIGMLFVIAIVAIFAEDFLSYLLGALAVILFLMGYLHNGLSKKGFLSVYRGARYLRYEDTDKVIIERNRKNVTVFYTGKSISYKQVFNLKNFEKIQKLLKENIQKEKLKIEYKN